MTLSLIRDASRSPDPELKIILILASSLLSVDIANWQDAVTFIHSYAFEASLSFYSNNLSLPPFRTLEDLHILRVQLPPLIDSDNDIKQLMHSWVEGAFEYSILKHELRELQAKVDYAATKIRRITSNWPNKTSFLIKAYQIFKIDEMPNVNYPTINESMMERINFIVSSYLN
jgi:hypothetical protein